MTFTSARLAAVLVLAFPGAAAAAGESTITSGPPASTNETSATFTFTSTEQDDVFECRFGVAAEFTDCASPLTVADLAEGAHTLYVRARDESRTGTVEETPSTRSWTVDLTPPETALTQQPAAATTEKNAVFGFSSPDPTATFLCSLNGAAPSACTSPRSYLGLGDATRSFTVRAVDAAGNQDPTPPAVTWTVDTTAPDTTILSGPEGISKEGSPKLTFSATEAGGYECRLDGGAWAACATPHTLLGLGDGGHTLEVRGLDALGNADPTPAIRTWTSDSKAPPVPSLFVGPHTGSKKKIPGAKASQRGGGKLVKLTAAVQLVRSLRVEFTSPGAVSYDVEVMRWFKALNSYGTYKQPYFEPLATDTTGNLAVYVAKEDGRRYCFRVRATDAVGNDSAWKQVCTFLPESATSMQRKGAWKAYTATGHYLNRFMRGTGGGHLETTVDGGDIRHVWLVATKCPTCGKVQVAIMGLPAKTLDLQANKVLKRQLIKVVSLPAPLKEPKAGQFTITPSAIIKRVSGLPRVEGLAWGP